MGTSIKRITSLKKITGRRFLVRVDFNVPIEKGLVGDDYRIRKGAATIAYLADRGAKVTVICHLGDPVGQTPEFSCLPLAKKLAKITKRKVSFCPGEIGEAAISASRKLKKGEILMLDNLRFNAGEKNDSLVFAKILSGLGEIYINDAFAVCHRRQASVSAVCRVMPSYAGLLLAEELDGLSRAFLPKKPMVLVMGGAKISTKAPMIARLIGKSDSVLVGGVLANTFLAALGREIGKSLFDQDAAKEISRFIVRKKLDSRIILPQDFAVLDRSGRACSRRLGEVCKSDRILDIGPESAKVFCRRISLAQTIVWNGPMGKYEDLPFKFGTLAVASAIASRAGGRAFGIVGGGETIEALSMTKMEKYVDFISTGGGAMLAFLGKEPMPGLKGIMRS
jgi:phosphoglycerate kinase